MDQQQQSQLKLLIAKGKEQGYLTYAEVNDHLPNDIVDPDQIEDIVNMINDMGITVREVAPEADELLLNDNSVTDNDETAAEEAEAALATVDSEFGRTTDPVRMYMREMGTVELLTREGEIAIAKRIEDGLAQVFSALAHFPQTTGILLEEYQQVRDGNMRLTDFLTGFIDPEARANEPAIPVPAAKRTEDDDDEPVDTGPDPEDAENRMSGIEALYKKSMKMAEKNAFNSEKCGKQRALIAEALELIKLTPKMVDRISVNLRGCVRRVRTLEKQIMTLCVVEGGMPRKTFIESFPKNETDQEWLPTLLSKRPKWAKTMRPHQEEVAKLQGKLKQIEDETRLHIHQIKEINRKMSIG
ncbi:MAG: RNA polymerase sigma factor region1.1 domain-containing protein, partial [Gammaproteobacteria bacterium]